MAQHRAEAAVEKSLTQAHSFANTANDLICDFVSADRSAGEDIIDVRFILENFFTTFAHRAEIFPEFFEQLLFEVAVASTAFYKSVTHLCDFSLRCDQRVELEDCRGRRILGRIHRQGIGTVLHAVSRHGLLPRAHLPVPANNCTPAEPGGTALDLSPDRADGSLSLTELVRRVEQAAAADPGAWRSLVDSVRPHVQGLWSALTDAERQCFLADRARRWEVVRHRMAPEVAARLGDLLAQQRLQVHAGGLTAITPADDGSVRATLVDGTELAVDGVLDCTGGLATAAPLVRTLVAQGIASLDALALGLRTNEHGALLAADGAPQERLYTLGPLRRGELYETTAVPEIRAQAQALAARILEQLRAQLRR